MRTIRRALTLGLASALAATSSALSWTQIYNDYPNPPSSCTNPGGYCIEWPLDAGGLSFDVDVYLWASLSYANIDLKTDVRNTFTYWNAVPAVNPYLRETTSQTAALIEVWRGATFYPDSWAETTPYPACCTSRTMTAAEIVFSQLVTWNRNYAYGPLVADARKVSMHEMGHAEALGHTGISPAVMRRGEVNYWKPQYNDRIGLIAIYGALP